MQFGAIIVMSKIRKTILPARLPLVVLFIIYSGSIMMFHHTHEVQGFLITHSHPYKQSSKKGTAENHSHTTSQYLLLQHLCETTMTDSIERLAVVPDLVFAFCCIIISPYSDPIFHTVTSKESLRAPPVC